MTQKKQLQEQVASHTYKRAAASVSAQTLQRVVTIPEVSPMESWNEFELRRKQLSYQRTRSRKYVGPVARTFAQTGTYAPGGQARTMRRPFPGHGTGTRVPQRSGRLAFRRGLFWKLLSVLAGGVLVMLAANFAFAGNAFRIEQVTVLGTHNDTLVRSIQRMGMQGQNIFLLNVPALSERITTSPLVNSVVLSKQLPNQLIVTVSERTPFLLWSTAQGVYSVDSSGVVIGQVDAGANLTQLSTVVDVSHPQKVVAEGKVQAGTHLQLADIAFAASLFKLLPSVLGNTAFTLRYDGTIYATTTDESAIANQGGTFSVKSVDGWVAYLGKAKDANPLENKLLELQQLLLFLRKQQLKVATIDLRYGLHPVYTLK
jgi:POTRA domain, FtsQ-type